MAGDRHNAGKPKLSLVLEARHALAGAARVLEFGATKYSRANWRKGLKHTEVADCLSRHLAAYLAGEDRDEESGELHIDHVLVNALFLAEVARTHPGLDDRGITAAKAIDSVSMDPPALGPSLYFPGSWPEGLKVGKLIGAPAVTSMELRD
ncbi:dATP/dGTP diphosphohydrolase domain-containing protein [Lysobacter enzymogenes]|uniref:dATP/dGTP diphosphohydrolase domain-containing protein n=1 Tax=Lysobacter enzymogenes TaxID=69 RepID=UPI001A961D06|nr:dATP/dGTP diphosphohydrolase domain-containing protein [Lysobacter enzymogenes]QQP96530.1 hypothetical protein JHW38_00280 [Lysobacter enzymogenes]